MSVAMQLAPTLSQEWFAATELAAMDLPGLAATERSVRRLAARLGWQMPELEGRRWRTRQASGGGIEYHWSALPHEARLALAGRLAVAPAQAAPQVDPEREERARMYDALPGHKKEKAERAVAALDLVQRLVETGTPRLPALAHAATLCDVSRATLYNWQQIVAGLPREDWRYWLAPRQAGNGREETPILHAAWQALCGLYLRLEQPTFEACWREMQEMARAQGWSLPSSRTARRRLEALPVTVLTLLRKGEDAFKRLFPAQRRSVGHLRALSIVNADGHIWDVFCRFEDGSIGRPVMVAFQDIHSRAILSWRLDRSENQEVVRLAFGDIVSRWGIPDEAIFDNGRHFASKWLTGGAPNRFRFKVREEEPTGILVQLGVRVGFTLPYSGQSKPIERVFGDFSRDLAKHPRFAGAYVGNNPMAKPENYGSHAVPIAEFAAVLEQGIAEWNNRIGRRGGVANGRSYQQVLEESWASSAGIRRATAEQQRLWLMAAEGVTVRDDSTVHLLGNRYHADWMVKLRGTRVVVRFDPDNMHTVPVHLYRPDGIYLGEAPCIADVGFDSKTASQDIARLRKAALNSTKKAADALNRMSLREQSKLRPAIEKAEGPSPEQRVIHPVFGSSALKARPVRQEEADDAELLMLRGMEKARTKRPGLRLIDESEND